ncbi:MAG: hypothetical protein KC917_06905 [Candidatus Omnitrophica bacterium]|nr:hypothetical protein [Candidatus Omnitrophota bacterium]
MNRSPKIVVIGAGSASFGLSILGKLLLEKPLSGSRLCLVDINKEGLTKIHKLADRLNREWDAGFTIESSPDRREMLRDADFVVLSIAIDREECWRKDVEIAKKYGIAHYAENGGPGAFAHTARNLAVVMDILRDVEELCPNAWLLNFTNPVPRISIAARKYTQIKTVGICHQIGFGYMVVGNLLQKELGIEVPENYRFYWEDPKRHETEHRIADEAKEKVSLLAAGINHFTWMLGVRHRQTGEDLYPALWERHKTHYKGFEPLTRELADLFGLYPVSGDCHLCEYLPYSHNMNRGVWERYDIQMYNLDLAEQGRDQLWEKIDQLASGKGDIDYLREAHTERAEKVISGLVVGQPVLEESLNIPNRGYIQNLPEGAIVEVPAMVSAHGIHGVGVGNLPEGIAEICRRQITVAEMVVESAVTGDKELALRALALDTMIDDPQVARDLLNDYLTTFKDYLPQFA